MSIGEKVRAFLFRWSEMLRRVIHFRIVAVIRRHFASVPNADLSEYYKLYDVIYRLSDNPEFVKIYKSRELIREDFVRLRKGGLIPQSGSLLDLGCGEGGNAIYFQALAYKVSGVDVSENAIRLAKRNAIEKSSNAVFEVADVIDFGDGEDLYDVCTDIGCLHMLVFSAHRRKYIEAVRRRLKPNGVFYLFQSAAETDVTLDDEEEFVATRVAFKHRRMLESGKVVQHQGCGGIAVSLSQYCHALVNARFEVKHAELVRTPIGLFASIVATLET